MIDFSSFLLMTFANAAICIMLPKMLSIKWSEILAEKKVRETSTALGELTAAKSEL